MNPRPCCKALTASCLACSAGVKISEYCNKHPETPGCQEYNARKKNRMVLKMTGWFMFVFLICFVSIITFLSAIAEDKRNMTTIILSLFIVLVSGGYLYWALFLN